MPKLPSEAEFGKALRDVDLPIFVQRLPDVPYASNWRVCDYQCWWLEVGGDGSADSAWFECKDTRAVEVWNIKEFRPSQRRGIEEAAKLGIPYWLAIYWRRHRTWTISDAVKLTADEPFEITKTLLSSRFGVDSSSAQLSSTLRLVLLGEAL